MDVLETIYEDFNEVKDYEEEIVEKIVQDFDEIKLNDYQSQDAIILVEDNTSNFIDFIGVERFDAIIDSYLMNIVNCMKIKEK